jgi:DNA-3-methyladenine glycosylase II
MTTIDRAKALDRPGVAHRIVMKPQAPFRLDLTAWALRRRPHNAIDRFSAGVYRRALIFDDGALAVSVRQTGPPRAPALEVEIAGPERARNGSSRERSAERFVRGALERLLGLRVDLAGFMRVARKDPLLGPLALRLRGLKPPRFPTVFEALVNGIACQQLSLEVGIHLLDRLTAAYGPPVPGNPDGLRAFPAPHHLAEARPARLRTLGFSTAKARAIVGAAQAICAGALDLEGLACEERQVALERLTALPGVGRWTAEYVLLRGLGRIDTFPVDDVGARNKLARLLGTDQGLDATAAGEVVARWRPFAGMVYFHLLLDSLCQAGVLDAQPARQASRRRVARRPDARVSR